MIALTRNAALRVTLIYFVFSLLWTLLSDRLLDMISASMETLSALQSLKGGLFIVVTSIGLLREFSIKLSPTCGQRSPLPFGGGRHAGPVVPLPARR